MKNWTIYIPGAILLFALAAIPILAQTSSPNDDSPRQEANVIAPTTPASIEWEECSNGSSPEARLSYGITYDSDREVTVIFGGHGDHRGYVLDDTWEWDGTSWINRAPSSSPSERYQHRLVYDKSRDVIVLFGGLGTGRNQFLSDTWEYNGTNWTQCSTANKPSARGSYNIVYDKARNYVILFGGHDATSSSNETWKYDGVNWENVSPVTSPPARYDHAMGYDKTCECIILFGGYDGTNYMNDTWKWDGAEWTQLNPASAPSKRIGTYHLVYDETRDNLILFGGYDGSDYLNDIWEWNGVNWIQLISSNTPTARAYHAMVYDDSCKRGFLFGGRSDGYFARDDAWEYHDLGANFALSASPHARTVYQYQQATYTITLDATPDFASPVTLTVSDLDEFNATVTPSTISKNEAATLTIDTNLTTATGMHTLIVSGTGDGLTRTTNLTLTVLPADFTIEPLSSSKTVYQGQSANYILVLETTPGFEELITLTATTIPGTTSAFSTSQPERSNKFATLTEPYTPISSRTKNSSTNEDQSALSDTSVALILRDEPSIDLTADTLTGTTLFLPGQLVTFAITTGLSTPAQSHSLLIEGKGGGLTDTITLTLDILPASISLIPTPLSRTIYQGQSISYTIVLTATPTLTLPVTLSTSEVPAMETSLIPRILQPGEAARLILTSSLTTDTNLNTVMITGTGTILQGTNRLALTSTAKMSLTVQPIDFALDVTPAWQTVHQGEAVPFLIELALTTPGFAFPVSLNVNGVPTGTYFSILPSEITVGAQAQLLLTITRNTPLTSHELSVTGVVGKYQRSARATIEVRTGIFLPLIVKRWPPIPYKSILNSIENEDGDGFYTVSWPTTDLAESYSLEEDNNQIFSSPTRVYNGTKTSWAVSEPGKTAGVYYYRVRGHNIWGFGEYSNIESVTVLVPDTPTIDSIDNADGDGSYVVTWNAPARTTSYILQEDTVSAFSHPVTVYEGADQSWSATNKPAGTYYYRVKGSGPTGQSEWSNVQSATVPPPPPPLGDGFYRVGSEIRPGKWHSTGTGDTCYWARYDSDNNILDNHFGNAGGTVNVRTSDYEVEFSRCGTWVYVENTEKVLLPNADEPKVDGFYTVGVEIVLGRWESTGTGNSCYWARLDSYQNILDNHFGNAGGTVNIRDSDYEVEFSRCGTWMYLGP